MNELGKLLWKNKVISGWKAQITNILNWYISTLTEMFCQSKENECMWTHNKHGATWQFEGKDMKKVRVEERGKREMKLSEVNSFTYIKLYVKQQQRRQFIEYFFTQCVKLLLLLRCIRMN